ncbi:MAG: inorganic phosphate transporter [Microcoleus vaginatus WJT46-NPBG5]|jgi:PiT family inorganic phosphate transporter|nr:inorganic phosphate transporter [Microcoleus vaginatus WJT46-NPBG5]
MAVLLPLLAFYVAWNLGANDVANSMGTSVGSKALTLRQALVVAGILEFTGAVLFGQSVSSTIATQIVDPAVFAAQPTVLLTGMVSVMLACGLWVQVATSRGWPVSSSHAVVGAIAGFTWVAAGVGAVNWSDIRTISLTWIATPFVSGIIAAGFYSAVKRWILDGSEPMQQLREWIPWLSSALLGVFGVIVLPTLSAPVHAWLVNRFNLNIPAHDLPLAIGAGAAVCLTLNSWAQLEKAKAKTRESLNSTPTTEPPLALSNSALTVERQLARFQILSACFVAFAHGSNDVGNAVAPLAAIAYIRNTGTVPTAGFTVPLWILVLGGAGIVAGLAVLGKKVITTVGEDIIALQPSGGFCAELATATTVLIASKLGMPVSTSHALVGGVIGIGLVQSLFKTGSQTPIRFQTIQGIFLAWIITVPIAAGLGAGIFAIARQIL